MHELNTALKKLCRKLGYQFKDVSLLETAITHRSLQTKTFNNERLEFLGDSILNFVIAAKVFALYPKAEEGQLTRIRANLVKGETLAEIAKELDLGSFLQMGAGELRSGGRQRTSILADALEAIIAALYLDGGMEVCERLLHQWYAERLSPERLSQVGKDPKTTLQEYLQARRMSIPRYILLESTTDQVETPIFKIECRVEALNLVTDGTGSSRRRAEQIAARKILDMIQQSL